MLSPRRRSNQAPSRRALTRSPRLGDDGTSGSLVGPRARGRHAVLAILLAWWLVCFSIYATGLPIAYTHRNAVLVAVLFGSVCVAAVLGFRWGLGRATFHVTFTSSRRVPVVVLVGLVATLGLVVPLSQTYSGFSVLEVGTALQDQGAAYAQATQRIGEGFGARSSIVLAQTALAPFTLVVLPYLALKWFESRRFGILLLLALAAPIVQGLLVGRDQQTGLAVVLVTGAWVLSRVRRRMALTPKEAAFLAIAAVVGILAFSARKSSRTGTSPLCAPGSDRCTLPFNDPGLLESAWVRLASYASQGFEGLGRALDTEWVFGGGISHSSAVQGILSSLLGTRPAPTVTTQLTNVGWSDYFYWSTSLTSLANDVPWILVPLVIAAQAFLLGVTWKRALARGDWLSTAVFCYTFLALLFMPQNLQLAQSGPLYIGYSVLVVAFLVRELVKGRISPSRQRVVQN